MKISIRKRKCTICRTEFLKLSSFHQVCSPDCVLLYAQKQAEKKQRKNDRERKEKLKTRSDYLKEAQTAFNAYIRARDQHQLCICCDKPLRLSAVGGGFDCGHYRSVGSAPHLRFDERNAHGQRKQCNRYGAGRAVDYRLGLIKRIGLTQVKALEHHQMIKKWTKEELISIRMVYRKKLKDLKLHNTASN